MRVRAFSCRGAALIGLSLSAWGCNQNSPAVVKPAAQSDSSKPRPLKYKVNAEAQRTPGANADATAETPLPSEPVGVAPVAKAAPPLDELQAADLTMPTVVLSQAHAQTCLVGVGGSLPNLQLADLQGTAQSLGKLLGSKLTVVVFWNATQPSALQELSDLGPDVAERFSGYGVAVVGVNLGDDPQVARELVKAANARFPILGDPQGTAFAEIATKKLPRTYLIDSAGKIAWLDIEYSRTTRRELVQAIRFLLSHDPAAKPQSP